jgi:hypothetical protein
MTAGKHRGDLVESFTHGALPTWRQTRKVYGRRVLIERKFMYDKQAADLCGHRRVYEGGLCDGHGHCGVVYTIHRRFLIKWSNARNLLSGPGAKTLPDQFEISGLLRYLLRKQSFA